MMGTPETYISSCKNVTPLSDFERGMIFGTRQAGLSISETADLLRISHTNHL